MGIEQSKAAALRHLHRLPKPGKALRGLKRIGRSAAKAPSQARAALAGIQADVRPLERTSLKKLFGKTGPNGGDSRQTDDLRETEPGQSNASPYAPARPRYHIVNRRDLKKKRTNFADKPPVATMRVDRYLENCENQFGEDVEESAGNADVVSAATPRSTLDELLQGMDTEEGIQHWLDARIEQDRTAALRADQNH